MDAAAGPRLLVPLGQRVRALRSARGLTVRELAARARLSPRFVAQLEAGTGNISVARLAGVAEALGSSASALLQGLHAAPRPGAPAVVALLGVRGAGKTTIGRLLARRLRRPFLELDSLIEAESGLSLRQIFDLHGEPYFRRVEREVLERVLDEHHDSGAVLATGGGLVTDARAFRLLRSRAVTVWLKATPEDHWNRVVAQGDRRPMAENPHAMAELRALLQARAPLYAEAEIVVDTSASDVDETVARMVAALPAASGGSEGG